MNLFGICYLFVESLPGHLITLYCVPNRAVLTLLYCYSYMHATAMLALCSCKESRHPNLFSLVQACFSCSWQKCMWGPCFCTALLYDYNTIPKCSKYLLVVSVPSRILCKQTTWIPVKRHLVFRRKKELSFFLQNSELHRLQPYQIITSDIISLCIRSKYR